MGKKNIIIDKTEKTAIIEVEKKGKYLGAEWIGAELFTAEFGLLEKGKIYPLTEDRAKVSDGFKPIYEGEKLKGGK